MTLNTFRLLVPPNCDAPFQPWHCELFNPEWQDTFPSNKRQSNTKINYYPVHDGVIKWKHFPRYWSFVRGIPRSPGNSPHKGQWRGALMFSLISAWINGWVNNREAGDSRRHRAHYDVIVMGWYIYALPGIEYPSNCSKTLVHDMNIHNWRHVLSVYPRKMTKFGD